MQIIIFLILVSFSFNVKSDNAWWVDFRYAPASTSLFGIKAPEIHNEFTHIELYTCNTDKYFTKNQCLEVKQNNAQFEISGDFNNDGALELWNVGISKRRDSTFSHTIIIRNLKTKKIEQVLTVENKEPMFSTLIEYKGMLRLFFCMECGDYAKITWKNSTWAIEWPEFYD